MTGNNNLKDAQTTLDGYLEEINEYVIRSNCQFSAFREEYIAFANMDAKTIKGLTQDELFQRAFSLYNYSNYLQDQVSINRVIVDWCNTQLELLLAKTEFDKFTKHEAKIPLLVVENSFAAKVYDIKNITQAKLHILEGKVYEVRQLGNVVFEKAKRK